MDARGIPTISLGVPIHDASFSRPASTGVPIPPWAVGSQVSGRVFGLAPRHSLATLKAANPTGSGRSVLITFHAGMDGLTNSYLETPKTPFGMVPGLGSGQTWKPVVYYLYNSSTTDGQTIVVKLRSFNAAGSATEVTLGTINLGDSAWGEWRSGAVVAAATALATDRRYFSIRFYCNSNGVAGGFVGLDEIKLGWLPDSTAAQWITVDEYAGDGWAHPSASKVLLLQPEFGQVVFPYQAAGGVTGVNPFSIHFIRISATLRNNLFYLWRAARGSVSTSADNSYTTGTDYNWLQGLQWPLVIRPNRPGTKEIFYAFPTDDEFPLVIDQQARHVEAVSLYSGTMNFIEQVY